MSSRKLSQASDFAERLYWRLYQAVDDFGRFHGDPALILGRCFPLMTDSVSHQRVREGRDELVRLGLIRLYQVAEDEIVEIVKFGQRVRQSRPKFPGPDDGGSRSIDSNLRSIDSPPARDVSVYDSDPRSPNGEGSGEGRPALRLVDEPDPCQECLSLLALLNDLTCRTYTGGGGVLSLLHDRHEQYGREKVIAVIRDRVSAWGGDPKMHQFLRPETLFSSRKFDGYVNALLGPVEGKGPQRCPRCLVAYAQPGRDLCWQCLNPRAPVVMPSSGPEKRA